MALLMERLLFLRSAIPGATYLPDAKPIPISVATGPHLTKDALSDAT